MRRTRSVTTLLLAAATLLALALGATVAAAGEPANRGWSSPVDAVEQFSGGRP